jgi:hypothetical protein
LFGFRHGTPHNGKSYTPQRTIHEQSVPTTSLFLYDAVYLHSVIPVRSYRNSFVLQPYYDSLINLSFFLRVGNCHRSAFHIFHHRRLCIPVYTFRHSDIHARSYRSRFYLFAFLVFLFGCLQLVQQMPASFMSSKQ